MTSLSLLAGSTVLIEFNARIPNSPGATSKSPHKDHKQIQRTIQIDTR